MVHTSVQTHNSQNECVIDSSIGYLKGFSIENILSMVEMDQESWTLKVNSDGRVGFLYFQNGKIIDAEVPGYSGTKAAMEILLWEDSAVEIKNACSRQTTIQTSLMNILLESNRIKDESKENKELEKQRYEEAVAHIIAFRLQQGQEKLIQVLRSNPKFHMGWLWYSRTISTIKDIGTALDHALRLAPENKEIKVEKTRFIKAQGIMKEATVKRCPFCWVPLNTGAQFCFSCNLQLVITKAPLDLHRQNRDPFIVDQSVKRFSMVLEREKNLYVSYYMAIAHYNMNDQDRTLELLKDAVALSGDRTFFKKQLKTFLAWTVSKKAMEAETAHRPGNNKKILVVEDSTTTRKVISTTLTKEGYRVVEAADGLQALSMIMEEQPDIILLDIILPKMNGFEILSVVKNKDEFKNLPVIMLTGRDGFINKMKGKMAGATAYLTKPFQPENLLRTIEKYI